MTRTFTTRLAPWAVAVAAAVLGHAVSAADDAETAGPAAAGERILTEQCARCHAIGKTGDSPLPLAPAFRSLATRYPLGHLAEALAEGITTGHPEMPEFVFTPDEIAAILAHMERISPPASKP